MFNTYKDSNRKILRDFILNIKETHGVTPSRISRALGKSRMYLCQAMSEHEFLKYGDMRQSTLQDIFEGVNKYMSHRDTAELNGNFRKPILLTKKQIEDELKTVFGYKHSQWVDECLVLSGSCR